MHPAEEHNFCSIDSFETVFDDIHREASAKAPKFMRLLSKVSHSKEITPVSDQIERK
jgi:hypothetical protein